MIPAHLWFYASLLMHQGKPRCGQKAVICLQNMTMEDVALRNLNILRFMRYIYAYVSGSLSLPSQMLVGQKETGLC